MKPGASESHWSTHQREVASLYHELLDCWNRHDAQAFASLFALDGHMVGFDGSMLDGRSTIESELRRIFADHVTASYVSKVRGISSVATDVAMLRAVAGMVPPGQSDINPAVNAIQTMVASKRDGQWRIALFQNTPAAFHGRPELSDQLTEELRQQLPTGALNSKTRHGPR